MIRTFKTSVALVLLTGFISTSHGQDQYTISGSVKDASTGEDLIGAVVSIDELEGMKTAANVYGFYSLTAPKGEYSISYKLIGYTTITKTVKLDQDIQLNIELAEGSESLGELVVLEKKEEDEMGVMKVTPDEIETIPVLLGEKDVLKVFQLKPGVKSAGEGNSGFFVRGGGADQNLILLDEAPVYNASHLLGFFSVFNSDVIKDVTLYKGDIPAKYGGRASSVMDIKLNNGNSKQLAVKGGIGLISSKLAVEAPIVKNKGSFAISGRRTYADLFLKYSKNTELRDNKLYFYDLTAKANYQIGKKDRIFLSGYFGRDVLGFGSQFGFDWGNKTGTLRWNHIFGDKLFSNTSVIFSDYSYKIKITENNFKLTLSSLIRDINIKQDYSYYLNNKNTITFGFNSVYHKFLPGNLDAGESNSINISNKHAIESAAYVQNDQKVSESLSLRYGLRLSHFNYIGPSVKYTFDSKGNVAKKETFEKWKSIQQYTGLEPRLGLTYQLNKTSNFSMGYNRNYQYMHLLSNSTSTQPNDIWIPSTNNIKPLIADQFSMGYFKKLKKDAYVFSTEVYYKNLKNQLDYKDHANLFLNETVENQLVFGRGYAYGAEFMLKKNTGKLTGWVAYTYSRSFKKIPEINKGKAYSAKQDRIHDISIVAMYKLTERVKLASNWVFYTGNAVTFPSGKYEINGQSVPYYTERNGYRMPNYHRLDVGVTLEGKQYKLVFDTETGKEMKVKKKFTSSWNISAYNAYARKNPYTITFRQKEGSPNQTEAVQTTLFSIVPSVSYNFKF